MVATKHRKGRNPKADEGPLTLEAEILSLNALAPGTLAQLPVLFAESVVDSTTKALGYATAEALVRRIGDAKLRDPGETYPSLDSFLHGGSTAMKEAISQAFRLRVHGLYTITMKLAL